MAPAKTFSQYLADTRKTIDRILADPAFAPKVMPPVLADAVHAYIAHGGKRLRPVLVLLSCGAVGGNEEDALFAAAAAEVFHTWTLVHDDVIDRDDRRRGKPTVHMAATERARTEMGLPPDAATEYGRAVAILAGDIQQGWSTWFLLRSLERGVPSPVVTALAEQMNGHLVCRLIEGEMLDVALAQTPFEQVNENEVLRMMALKTGALLEYCAFAGATVGTACLPEPGSVHASLQRAAGHCGLAFQLQDDILGISGDEAVLGKPVGSDIREGKRTILALTALANAGPAEKALLLHTLGNRNASPGEVAQVSILLRDLGGVARAQALAEASVAQAHAEIDALPESIYREHLHALADMMLQRVS